ncbi:MAG: hypothetical protein IKO36_10635 [Bacteroidaceae bacterium]|nr:hypothetical protein [Bacteroidaceae bacterium]
MIVWNVFDGQGNYKLTCPTEESASKVVETYKQGWNAKPVDTDFGGEFADKALYTVNVRNDMQDVRAFLNKEPQLYGYTKNLRPLPYKEDYGRDLVITLLAKDARDAIDKALELIKGKEEHI